MRDHDLIPLKGRRTLTSLPKELLTLIASHLDISTAKNLAITAKHLTVPAESRIWSSINLVLQSHWGEYPLVQPHSRHSSRYCTWAKEEATRAEERGRQAAKELVKKVLIAGNDRKFTYIRDVTLQQRTGSNHAIVQLLDFTYQSVKSIKITPPCAHVFDELWGPSYYETFYGKLQRFDLTGCKFTSLTHLEVRHAPFENDEHIRVILSLTPNLVSLVIKLDGTKGYLWDDCDGCPGGPRLPGLPILDKLRNLSIFWPETDERLNDGNLCPTIVPALLDNSPHLTYIELTNTFAQDPYHERYDDTCMRELIEEHAHLSDAEEMRYFCGPSLHLQGLNIPHLNSLERIFIRVRYPATTRYNAFHLPPTNTFPDSDSEARSINPAVLNHIKLAPSLEFVQFYALEDEPQEIHVQLWKSRGVRGAVIRSLRSGDSHEMFHVRLLTYSVEKEVGVPDEIDDGREEEEVGHGAFYEDFIYAHDSPATGTEKYTTYTPSDELEWQDYTEYDGVCVPLNIIRQMRKAEGVGEWKGRGVKVGDTAWKILTDWRAGLKASEMTVSTARGPTPQA